MADYDGVFGYQDNANYPTVNISATAVYPRGGHHGSESNTYHGVELDLATIVSVASSCVILISGCIAVVCLIMYMKKTDMLYRSRTCAKCGAHVARDENAASRVPFRNESHTALDGQPPNMVDSRAFLPAMEAHTSANNNKNQGSIAIFRGFGEVHNEPSDTKNNFPFGNEIETNANPGAMLAPVISSNQAPVGDFFDDPNEPTPYATFNLPGFDKESKIGEVYETFTAKFTEPPYMLLKKGIDYPAPPQYADSVDYKMRLIENVNGKLSEDIYQATGLSQCQSVASSNHEELLRAYEYGKQQKQKLLKLQDEFIESLNENDNVDNCYLPSDRESPTDPGIREFTKSPPKPNEKRQGTVFHHHQPTVAEMLEISKNMTGGNEEELDIKETESSVDNTANKHDLSPNETSNSFSSIQGSSSEAQSTTSNGEDSSSSSTATPETHSSDENRQANFGAIRRDRSRNPSWASFTTMKSNTVLAPQYPGENQLTAERAFMSKSNSKSNSTIKEGFSSEEEEEENDHFEEIQKTEFSEPRQDLLEEIYSSRMQLSSSYASRGPGGFAAEGKPSGRQRTIMLEQAVAGSSCALPPNYAQSSQGPSQVDKTGALFPSSSNAEQRLPSMTNRDFNRTAL